MEEDILDNTAENNSVEGAGNADTQTANKNEGNAEIDIKAEAQKIADAMVAKKMKGMPSKEELKAYKVWQENQKTAEQKQAEKEAEYQKTQSELNTANQKIAVLEAGVNKKQSNYVLFEVSQIEGDFDENLEQFLKDNPEYLKQEVRQKDGKATGTEVKRINSGGNDSVLSILASKYPEIDFEK